MFCVAGDPPEKQADQAFSGAAQIEQLVRTEFDVYVPDTGVTHVVKISNVLHAGTADTPVLNAECGKTHVASPYRCPRSLRHADTSDTLGRA